MEKIDLIQSVIDNPFERLLLRISTCLLNEPRYYKTEETVVVEIRQDLAIVEAIEPSFIVKLAFYARNSLNLRSVSNFILAWAAVRPSTHPTFKEFFTSVINLPSDLIDFVAKYQDEIGNPEKTRIPTFLQKLIGKKFAEFNVYQLGKYCSEGKRKRELAKLGPKKITMKRLVRLCHIKEPKVLVASVIGKKYPQSAEVFVECGFGTADRYEEARAGKRMKIPTPYTWETTLGQYGNKAECWEELVKSGKLPFMAMLRNLRNMLLTGVDLETHTKVVEKLTNPEVIQNSRLFPFQFLSAYNSIEVDLDYMQNLKLNPDYQKPAVEEPQRRGYTGRGRGRGMPIYRGHSSDDDDESQSLPTKKRKVIIPKEVPTKEVVAGYKSAIDEAVKLSASLNIDPIRGNTMIFCDCSGSMSQPISSKKVTSFNLCLDVGYLFGLMIRSVSESCELFVFSSSSPPQIPKCWKKVDVQGDNIFELHKQLAEVGQTLGGGTEFPYDWFEEAIKENKWVDNFIIFTDMMISELQHDVFGGRRGGGYKSSYEIISEYREKVNPNMRYITVDLAGSAKTLKGAKYEGDFKNLLIGGYSDSILQMIGTSGVMQSDLVRECKPKAKKSSGKQA